ncbi:hypothetical protein [Leifsonia sp. AG29]|uniref:hypothetical protein n=1 Tax=Leifsonia sp. AG29 TaxID=2598860 RepID=UPI00131DC259|nr:hypothetical protein [Leifsonia sp. AG29]
MVIRRAFYWWLFPAAIVLPAWLLIGWAAFSQGSGWSFLGLLILSPLLFVTLLLVAGLLVARRSVRESRAVSWYDVGLLTAWHASIIAFGFFPPGVTPWLAVLGIALFLAAFWVALWELVRETRVRVQATFAAYEQLARPRETAPTQEPIDEGEYIVIEERRERD